MFRADTKLVRPELSRYLVDASLMEQQNSRDDRPCECVVTSGGGWVVGTGSPPSTIDGEF